MLLNIFYAKNGCKKKSLNKLLAADLLNAVIRELEIKPQCLHIPGHKHVIWQITVVFICTVHKCNIVKVAEIVEYFILIYYSRNGLFLLDTVERVTLKWKEVSNSNCFG